MRGSRPPVPLAAPDGLLLFDGVCVLCAASVQFVLAHDPVGHFRIVPIQSPYGETLARRLGIAPESADTIALIEGGKAYFKSDVTIEVLRRLPRWSWGRALVLVPRPIRDWAYDRVALNRYRLFGRRDTCLVPTPDIARRFLTEAPPEA